MTLEEITAFLRQLISDFGGTAVTVVIFCLLYMLHQWWHQGRKKGPNEGHVGGQLTSVFIVLVGVLTLIISLPIESSLKEQLFSLIGIVLSAALALSSTSIIGNALSGLILNTNPHLKPGEFIQVNEYQGRISERGLLHLEIQSEDKNLTTLPNQYVISNPYRIIHSKGTIISADISLGYDVNRKRIESLLLKAGEEAGLESPFVQILELGDFTVSYRVAGVLKEVKHRMTAKTELLKVVLDTLHADKIEIASPTLMSTRPIGEQAIIPKRNFAADPTNLLPIESIVFDKAEQAESLTALQEKLQRVRDGIEKLNVTMKECAEEERDGLQHRIDNLVKIKDRLKTEIERLEQEKQP